MAFYIVTGTLGSGKTLACVWRIQQYLFSGRRVAANIDLNQDVLVNASMKNPSIMRLPDKPTVQDIESLGVGYPDYNEEKFGLIVLEEAALWLNTRNFQDKTRKDFIDYLVNIRKRRWDVMIVIQNINALDKQVREMFSEFVVVCQRLDRLKIPFFSLILQTFGFSGTFSKLHMCRVRYGLSPHSPKADTWYFFGKSFYNAYNTMQEYDDSNAQIRTYSPLPSWHFTGGKPKSELKVMYEKAKSFFNQMDYRPRWFFFAGCLLTASFYGYSDEENKPSSLPDKVSPAALQPSVPEPVDYYRISGSFISGSNSELYFEKNGLPWRPANYGFKVFIRNPCHALIMKNSNQFDVFCGEADHAHAGSDAPQNTPGIIDSREAVSTKLIDNQDNSVLRSVATSPADNTQAQSRSN